MKFIIALILLSTTLTPNAFATAQIQDKIIYDGNEYELNVEPYLMDKYFKEHPDKYPKDAEISTALWRGYIATFEFNNNILILKDIVIEKWVTLNNGKQQISYKSVKNSVVDKGEVLPINWFTGILVLPYGECLNRATVSGFEQYSNYILLEIKNGKLTEKRNFNNDEYENFKEKHFKEYKKTESYKKTVEDMKEWGDTLEEIDPFIRNYCIYEYIIEFNDKEKKTSNKTINQTSR